MSKISPDHIGWIDLDTGYEYDEDEITTSTIEAAILAGVIPVFRPLDVPELADTDEVETMEAEVVTLSVNSTDGRDSCWYMDVEQVLLVDPDGREGYNTFNDIARASAKAREAARARGVATADALMGAVGAKRVKP